MTRRRRLLVASIAVAALATAVAWVDRGGASGSGPAAFLLLVGAAAMAMRARGRRSDLVVAALLVVVGAGALRTVLVRPPRATTFSTASLSVATAAIVVGLATLATTAGAWPRRSPASVDKKAAPPPTRHLRRRSVGPVATLLLLSPIGAELLAAYGDSTGRPGEVLFGLVFFAGLYGCPALLVREVARRRGGGWTSNLLLSAGAGLVQAGLVDQSFFAEQAEGVRGWAESVQRTYVDPLGLSAFNALSWLVGHVVFSFAAPIAVTEGLYPDRANRPWVGARGTALAVAAWIVTAGAILADLESGVDHRATAGELLVVAALVVAIATAAWRIRDRPPLPAGPATSVKTAMGGGFAFATAVALAPDNWLGVVFVAMSTIGAAAWLWDSNRRHAWSLAHAAATATGALVSRGLLAFLYRPLVGDVALPAKFAHNMVMLAVVAVAGVVSIRRSRLASLGDDVRRASRNSAR